MKRKQDFIERFYRVLGRAIEREDINKVQRVLDTGYRNIFEMYSRGIKNLRKMLQVEEVKPKTFSITDYRGLAECNSYLRGVLEDISSALDESRKSHLTMTREGK